MKFGMVKCKLKSPILVKDQRDYYPYSFAQFSAVAPSNPHAEPFLHTGQIARQPQDLNMPAHPEPFSQAARRPHQPHHDIPASAAHGEMTREDDYTLYEQLTS